MTEISRVALFGKLNPIAYQSVESATVFCKLRGNPYVELAHWLHQILQLQDSDLHRIMAEFELDPARLARDLVTALDSLPRGASSISDLSAHLLDAVERAWVYASLLFKEFQIRTGHLLVGILKTSELRHELLALSGEFGKVGGDTLTDNFARIVSNSPEEGQAATDGTTAAAAGSAAAAPAPAQMGKLEALQRFSEDLTDKARRGEIDPIVGRDEEIRQIIDILMRRRQNNPILTGEAGVGKTAVVEGFARRLVSGEVPPSLRKVSLRALDLGLLQAGASVKGEFENRLKQIIEEVQSAPEPIILFIDEAHTLIGAGGAAGTGDAANMLKPALARGTLRTIAATTWGEYKKYFEQDPALTRRFQVIQVQEPDEDRALGMMRSVVRTLEDHHRVQVLDEALDASVRLSRRYIPARQLPDKSVSVLDTACARVAVGLHSVPPAVEDARHRIDGLKTELDILGREAAVGADVQAREGETRSRMAQEQAKLGSLDDRWEKEKALITRILEIRGILRGEAGPQATRAEASDDTEAAAAAQSTEASAAEVKAEKVDREALLAEMKSLQHQLAELQGDTPLLFPTVDGQVVASVISDWTGIPLGRMVKDEIDAVLQLSDTLNARVIGQRHALDMIARRIQTSRASLDNPNKPIGVFMLCGPSGVGKTETGLALAEALYGGEQNIITINMSEYQEAHTVSTLKGAPPGYVGYGQGGILTEAVRRKPYSVILLDEVEKAHPDVHEIFFQVFDKGWMEDSEGRYIDFRNTVILLTSNVGTDLIMGMCEDPDLMPDATGLAQAVREPLLKVFPPALLGRLVVIPYYPLTDEALSAIIRLQLGRIKKRIQENHGVPLGYDESVIQLIAERCTEVESGARVIDAILTNTLLPRISQEVLNRMLSGVPLTAIRVSVADNDFVVEYDSGAATAD